MQIFWLIFIAIIWAVVSAVGQKKRQQAKREAEAKAAARPQPARPAPASAPISPTVRPSVAPPPRPVSWAPVTAGGTSAPRPARQPGELAGSTLTELAHTQRHTLAPSHETGHAHQETSMTGIVPDADCPPVVAGQMAKTAETPITAAAGMPGFTWRPDAVRDGLIYAEILSKPKALRG